MATFRPAYILTPPDVPPGTSRTMDVPSRMVASGNVTAAKATVIPWVSSIAHDPMPAVAFTLTQSKIIVEGHPDGIRINDITLAGGVQWPALRSFGLGDDSESESHKRLKAVTDLCAEALTTESRSLYFYAVDEGIYLEVVPLKMRTSRGQSNDRINVRYDLSLRGIRKIAQLVLVNAIPATFKTTDAQHWYDGAAQAYANIKAAIEKAYALYKVGYNYARTANDVAGKIIDGMTAVANGIAALVSDLAYLLRIPYNLRQRLRHLGDQIDELGLQTKQSCWDFMFERGLEYEEPETTGESWATSDGWATTTLALVQQLDAVADSIASMVMMAQVAGGQQTDVEAYWTVGTSDTLESIALATYGDASRASDIASANGLRYPWTGANGGIGIAKPGDRLRVPGAPAAALATAPRGDEATSEEAIYGTDWRLDATGDLYRVGSDSDVDFDLVAGVSCVVQAVWCRMLTTTGTNRCFPTFGLPAAIGYGDFTDRYAAYIVAITTGFLQDDRITRVSELTAQDGGNGWSWEGVINLVTGVQLARTGAA